MKKFLLLLILFSFVLSAAEQGAKKKSAVVPALENPKSWTIAVVPDIQVYICKNINHGILDMMCAWLVHNKKKLNIQQVLFTGDLVNQNGTGRYRPGIVDLVCEEQWEACSRLLSRLDGRLPYVLCLGNHDYGINSSENRHTYFNKFFKSSRNPLSREQFVECNTNAQGINTMENAAFEFTAPYPDERKFLIITIPFAPTDQQLAWSRRIADMPRFADHFGIILTHSYMHANGERIKDESRYNNMKRGGNPGEMIYQKVVAKSKNIRLVVCGHINGVENWEKSVGFSETVNGAGKKVAQMVFNTQAIGSWNGGDGWLRLLEFMPDKKTVKARTYSPFFAASSVTKHLAWKSDSRNEFSFVLE